VEECCIELPGDRQLEIRPTTPDDAPALASLYDGLTEGDRHRRFFGGGHPSDDWVTSWAAINDHGGFGVIALVHEGDRSDVVGEAGYAMRSDGDGDLAVTVASGFRGWLGPYLLEVLVEHAATVGVDNLQAEVLLENRPMMKMLRHRGAVNLEHPDGVVRLAIATTGYVPSWAPEDDRPRVLVEVAGGRWTAERPLEDAGLAAAMCSGPDRRHRSGCPVLEGEACPLADGADAIVVLLDPDSRNTIELIEAHERAHPDTPILVRPGLVGRAELTGCHELAGAGQDAAIQILSLVGHRD